VRVVDTNSILKNYCLDLSFDERATASLFHVGASQYYCVRHSSARGSDGGLTMQVSCWKDKPNMRQFQRDTHLRSSVDPLTFSER